MGSAASTLIHSARLISAGVETADAWVLTDGDLVVATGTGTPNVDAHTVVDARDVAGKGAVLTPGFIDLHCHGGAGRAFDDGADAIREARALHHAHGTTRSVISLVTAPVPDLIERVRVIAELTRTDPDILGSHLEGPFLNVSHKGAHEPTLLTSPTTAALESLLEAGAGTVRQVTLAPELPGAMDAIAQITKAGAIAAVGHSAADAATARAAFDAGATVLTHAFNGMVGIHHRAPGPVIAAAGDNRVVLEAIADNVHLDPQIVAMLFELAPGRIALITDAMAAAGSADGHYDLGAVKVTVTDGIARTVETDSIAGSTLTLDGALRHTVAAGVALSDAVDALTRTPATALGLSDRLGHLAPGACADWVLLTTDLEVAAVSPRATRRV